MKIKLQTLSQDAENTLSANNKHIKKLNEEIIVNEDENEYTMAQLHLCNSIVSDLEAHVKQLRNEEEILKGYTNSIKGDVVSCQNEAKQAKLKLEALQIEVEELVSQTEKLLKYIEDLSQNDLRQYSNNNQGQGFLLEAIGMVEKKIDEIKMTHSKRTETLRYCYGFEIEDPCIHPDLQNRKPAKKAMAVELQNLLFKIDSILNEMLRNRIKTEGVAIDPISTFVSSSRMKQNEETKSALNMLHISLEFHHSNQANILESFKRMNIDLQDELKYLKETEINLIERRPRNLKPGVETFRSKLKQTARTNNELNSELESICASLASMNMSSEHEEKNKVFPKVVGQELI